MKRKKYPLGSVERSSSYYKIMSEVGWKVFDSDEWNEFDSEQDRIKNLIKEADNIVV